MGVQFHMTVPTGTVGRMRSGTMASAHACMALDGTLNFGDGLLPLSVKG